MLMILWLVLGIIGVFDAVRIGHWTIVGGTVLEFLLFALLGWEVYGPAVK